MCVCKYVCMCVYLVVCTYGSRFDRITFVIYQGLTITETGSVQLETKIGYGAINDVCMFACGNSLWRRLKLAHNLRRSKSTRAKTYPDNCKRLASLACSGKNAGRAQTTDFHPQHIVDTMFGVPVPSSFEVKERRHVCEEAPNTRN